ncbi:MAG: DUF512 domain-containing protein [Bacillota bacterium]
MTDASKGGLVFRVEPGSLAEYLQIRPGDRIVSINGRALRDEIDFRFYCAEENVTLEIVTGNGQEKSFEIEKDPDDFMGITFENPIFDRMKTCRNNCCFCFISQLPGGLRKSLYVRDDDYRLSFLFGNFISLTNLSGRDWQRIKEQRLSPLRVSLHTSDPWARARLMGNPHAALAMEHLKELKDMGISVHIQIVLLNGVNDDKMLFSTLRDLESLGKTVLSVGVVPAVYTRYREIPPSPYGDPEWARDTLVMLENYAREMYQKRGVHWVYGADEFYFLSGRKFPEYDFYDDFPQFENGIGMTADFRQATKVTREELMTGCESRGKVWRAKAFEAGTGAGAGKGKIMAVTGVMAYPEIVTAVKTLGLDNRICVVRVRNSFFGDTVTCAGLLTGKDILSAVLGLKESGEKYRSVLIPSFSVFEGRFLDDMTVGDMAEIAGLPVQAVEPSPRSLADAALEPKGE